MVKTDSNMDNSFVLSISNPYAGIAWERVHQVKTALHNHTVNTNPPLGEWNDNVADTPKSRVRTYESQGYGAVAITEHDYVSYPLSDYGVEDSLVISIPGNELSKNVHMLSYFNTYFDKRGKGPSVSNGMMQNIANVGELGGFLYIAHPNRKGGATENPEYCLELLNFPQVLGIEVLNAGQFTNNHSEKLWDTLLTETMPYRNIWGTASDDSHSDRLATLGTGWTYLLLDNLSQADAREAMIAGRMYFSSYRVEKELDDNKMHPGISAPTIKIIDVDHDQGVISLVANDADTVEWISTGGAVVAKGSSINVNTTVGVSKYIRARIFGPGGQTMTQPFGLHVIEPTNPKASLDTIDFLKINGPIVKAASVGDTVKIPTAKAYCRAGRELYTYATVVDPWGARIVPLDNRLSLSKVGVYTVIYQAIDSQGNKLQETYNITVQ